jgi:hypothetical protein
LFCWHEKKEKEREKSHTSAGKSEDRGVRIVRMRKKGRKSPYVCDLA